VIPDRGFSRVQRFRSDVLELAVQPAVAPPAQFAGAAWLPAQRVTLSEEWGDDAELVVGIPRTRTIVVEGLGLLETQLPDLDVEQQAGIRQYADQPELARTVTADGLLSRRSVSFAVIAQSPGEVTLGRVQLPWWNVGEQRWEVAELPPRTLLVMPSAEAATPETAAPAADGPQPTAAPRGYWPWIAVALALAWLATIVAWWRGRTPRAAPSSAHAAAAERKPALRAVLRDLESACAVHDAAAARNALLQFAEVRFPASPPRSLGALAAALPEAMAHEVLGLEAHLYGAAAGAWAGDGLKTQLAALEKAGTPPEPGPAEPLLPLYR
jgi:hypothetical protein